MTSIVLAVLMALGYLVVGPTQVASAAESGHIFDDPPVTADPLPTTQIDGVAWSQAVSGSKVYVGGEFSNARPAGASAGQNLSPRGNLLAYNIETGVLDPSWAPTTNGAVRGVSVSPDGSVIYVTGIFTQVNGQARYRAAALDAATGNLLPWQPIMNARVYSAKRHGNVVYLAGDFTTVNGVARTKVAAVDAVTGALLPFNAEVLGGYGARGVVVSPDGAKVVIGGDFTSVNGSTNPGRGLAALDASSGASLPWAANAVVRNADKNAGMYSLSSDGDSVYATAWDFYGTDEDGLEGSVRMSWNDGSIVWLEDCHGDTYDVASVAGAVFIAGHPHYCGNIGGFPQTSQPWEFHHTLAFSKEPTGQLITPDIYGYASFTGIQAPRPLNWYPRWSTGTFTGQAQAAWSVSGNDRYVVFGGEFPAVNGVSQQGLVRFAMRSIAPKKSGPQVQGGAYKLNVNSFIAGQARLTWPSNFDRDNSELKYEVLRQDRGNNAPLHTFTSKSTFFKRPGLTYTDAELTPGQTYNYRIRVTDPEGNATWTDWTPVTVTATGQPTAYADAVLGDTPQHYWPLNDASGAVGMDWAGADDLTTRSVTFGQQGHHQNSTATAAAFGGASSSTASTTQSTDGPQEFTVETWFRTTSTRGGKLIGFGNAMTGSSGSYDRHVYLSNNGRVTFGVYPGAIKTVSSAAGFNDGQWHHVVASLGKDGQSLWLDGKLVGRNVDVVSAQAYSGYWRLGGDTLGNWPNAGTSAYLNGTIQDVAIYDRVLDRREIDEHWVASGRASLIPPTPGDPYGDRVYSLDPDLYWRLNDTQAATSALDSGIFQSAGVFSGSTTRQQNGALSGVDDRAVRFNGTGRLVTQRMTQGPSTYALEGWFNTTSATGGKIVGFGDSAGAANSTLYDRHVYLDAAGKLSFGAWSGEASTITSTAALNDGQWHHFVAQQSSAGMQLFVDGALVGQNDVQDALQFNGYWRVGGDVSWAGAAGFTGAIDEVAVYRATLTSQEVFGPLPAGHGRLDQHPAGCPLRQPGDRPACGLRRLDVAGFGWDDRQLPVGLR
ncbi:MAG: LamG domain-containing protein [Propioniciclava sp.]|uniref:LamG domain-containing protein n=1 Tax=Propioniciclava sp. TaxID=2038686 RepID=UPI0039E65CAF